MKSLLISLVVVVVMAIIISLGLGYRPWETKTVSGVKYSTSLPDISDPKEWVQIFSDNFNGTSLNTGKWVTCYDWYSITYNGCSNTGNNELEWYTPRQVTEHDGYLQLTALPNPTKGLNKYNQVETYPYRSGMISTGRNTYNGKPKSSYLYGYFIARMRVTSGKGVWPAFWLLPSNHIWPPEIDIMEKLGSKPSNVFMTYYRGSVDKPSKDETAFADLMDPSGWHTYAVDWQPGYINWYIDGVLRKSVVSSNVPSTPMEIIADLAIGGNLPGSPNSSTQFPANLDIDYIRVYEQTKT